MAAAARGTAIEWFNLFQENELLGLLGMDLLLIVDQVLAILGALALYVILRRSSEYLMAIALLLGFVGIAAYLASKPAFNMMSLSEQYQAATTEARRTALAGAGGAMLAVYYGTAFQLGYILQAIAGIITSVVMLRSRVFNNVTAYAGIPGGVIAFGLYVPTVGIFTSIFSVLFYEIWYILIARRLFQLAS